MYPPPNNNHTTHPHKSGSGQMAVRASTVMVGEGGAVVAAEPPQGELSRKERKKSQLRDKLETKLKAISRYVCCFSCFLLLVSYIFLF